MYKIKNKKVTLKEVIIYMCNINDKKEKERKIRETAETLYKKRYKGITESEEFLYPNFLEGWGDNEFGKFSANFMSAGVPRPREIFFTEDLLNELEELSEENNVEISTLINCYLLQMLERNKRTTEHTKARKAYIRNSLYKSSEYIQKCETIDEFEENVFDKEFINHKEISYKNADFDEEIYIKNFLLNNGYSLEQIQQMEKEEKEVFGTFKTKEGEVMNPINIEFEMKFKEVPALNYDYKTYVFIPTRLGLHYILLNKVETLNNYESIERFLNNQLEGVKKIWDLYIDYLNEELI